MIKRKRNKQAEHLEQCQVIEWCRWEVLDGRQPELKNIFAIPNGGLRDPRTAAALQREGVLDGVPDLCLPVAKGGYFGLYIEMKKPNGTIKKRQVEIGADLTRAGYKVIYCFSHVEAKEGILNYLAQKPTIGSV